LLGDEGSAYAVALAGLRKVARRSDGRESVDGDDLLTRLICRQLEIDDPSRLIATIYQPGFDRARIAAIAPAVVEAALEDWSIREEILEPAGIELALMVLAVARKLAIEPGILPMAQAGSFLLNSQVVASAMEDRLIREGYPVMASTVREPVVGGLILAGRALMP
jgi:N-acetylglucosamine kinase-like BadF-type ATPase